MKSVCRIFLASLLLAVLLVTSVFTTVAAAEKPARKGSEDPFYVPKKTVVYLKSDRYIFLGGVTPDDVISLKSSNKKVASAKVIDFDGNECAVVIDGKKAGDATISFKIKYDGKTYSYKCKVHVRKFINPFKTLKIGTLELEEYLDKASLSEAINAHVPLKKTLKNKKLSFKLKKGWKLKEAFIVSGGEVRNGQKITIKKGSELDFWITDPEGYDLWFYFFFD